MSIKSKESMFSLEVGVENIDISDEMEALEEEIRKEATQKLELIEGGDVPKDSLAEIEKAISVFGKLESGAKEVDISDEMEALEEEIRNERKIELETQIAQLKKELGQ